MRKFTITENDKKELCKRAPEFQNAVETIPLSGFDCHGNLFQTLTESVISQQLSVKAADTIFGRFKNIAGEITPENIASAKVEDLRSAGLSSRKIEYIKGIAEAAINGTVNFENIAALDDAMFIEELTKLKGVGVWTAEMMLIFALGRKDVLSFKDLGIRRGIMHLHGLDDLPEDVFETYRKRFSPYGTLASLYLWRIKDGGL